jgi:citrate lyase subunit beta/citryl-CoA lyase
MVERAHHTPADVIVLDLEDSVPPAQKQAAREAAGAAIAGLKAAGKSVHVRVNHHESGELRDDLLAVIQPGLDGLAFPKTASARDVRQLDILLRERELHGGVRPGSVVLFPQVESALGILNLRDIVEASTRIGGLALGAFDYARDLGVERSAAGTELAYARGAIVNCSAAYRIAALDAPYGDFRDTAGLAAETQLVRSMGFRGKYVIHPDQVEAVNAAFTPSTAEVDWARRAVAAFDEAVEAGHAAVQLDGRMVDTPVARQARDLIARAEAIAALGDG